MTGKQYCVSTMNTTYKGGNMIRTENYSPVLMEKYYLVHAYINEYAWFDNYDEAHEFLFSKWVDHRIAREVITPAK